MGTPLPPPRPPRVIVSAEVRLMREFHTDTVAKSTAGRADARARNVPVPEFPRGTNRMRDLLEKLSRPA